AGVFDILSGVLWIGVLLYVTLVAIGLSVGLGTSLSTSSDIRLGLVLVLLIAPAIVSIFGGISALKRKQWKWALAGSIFAIPFVLGLVSTALVILSKKEFKYD